MPLGGLADRVQLVGVSMRGEQARAAAFRHAVDFDQPARPAGQHVALQFGGERRAGREFHLETPEVERVEIGERHDALVLHGNQHRVGGAKAARQRQELAGLELAHQRQRAAHRQRRKETDQRRVGVERRRDERDGLRPVFELAGAPDMAEAHGVRLVDALGRACRAGGIDGVEDPVGLDRHARRRGARRRQPIPETRALAFVVERDAGDAHVDLARDASSRRVEEQQPRLTVARHVGEVLRRRARRQRRDDDPGAQGPEKGRDVFDRARRADRDRLARSHAVALQRGGDAIDQPIEFAIAQAPFAVDQRDALRRRARRSPHQLRNQREFGRALGPHGIVTTTLPSAPRSPSRAMASPARASGKRAETRGRIFPAP